MSRQLANRIRKDLKPSVSDILFDGFWVRVFQDGSVWVGANSPSERRMMILKEALEVAGYKCECNGKSGTAGQYIIEVKGS